MSLVIIHPLIVDDFFNVANVLNTSVKARGIMAWHTNFEKLKHGQWQKAKDLRGCNGILGCCIGA